MNKRAAALSALVIILYVIQLKIIPLPRSLGALADYEPAVRIVYSTVLPTNEPVRATLESSDMISIEGGSAEHVFTENATYTFRYQDESGKWYEATAQVDNIDLTPPVLRLAEYPPGQTPDQVARFALRESDAYAYRYQLDGSDWSEERPAWLPLELKDLLPGEHLVRFIARDTVGNWTAEEAALTCQWSVLPSKTYRPRALAIDRGEKAIEVSIAEQHMWLYEGERMISDMAITTGASSKGWGTETGEFAITQKHEDKWFEGGYFSHYWMRFNKGMGIHDASWRRNFGSQDYRWTGSHGCVNVPPDQMPWIYAWAETGTLIKVF